MSLATVLVVEDERVVAMHLRQQLTRLGYTVPFMATEGRQALRYIEQVRPDVVLMDIHIDGNLDGIETASLIPNELHIPVIYLTAYSEESTLERARATKPYGYLLKPFSERELHASIQMVLERRRADGAVRETAKQLELLVQARTQALQAANQELERQTQERLNAERALHHAQKLEALGHLTGGIAHDFNNLMQVVIGNLDRLLRLLPQEATSLRRTAQHAFEGATRAATFTQRLLAFASRQPLNSKALNVNELITGMFDLLNRSLGETVSVELKLEPDLWWVEADVSQLENAILNLALNARDAMPNGGTLIIETANVGSAHAFVLDKNGMPAPEHVRIAMRDSGHGMSADIATRAFEPFFTTKEVGKGTGLGLSQVYGFVKQSRGHVELDTCPGHGTTVHLYLPKFGGKLPVTATTDASRLPAPGGNETILVVEDDASVRFFSVEALRDLSYRVLEAGDGPTALRLLQDLDESIHLLFTDVVLPSGMNGADLAAEALRLRPGLKVLFTTGHDRNALADLKLETGVRILNKPFLHSDLALRIRETLSLKQAVDVKA